MVVVSHDCRSCRVVMLAIYDYVDSSVCSLIEPTIDDVAVAILIQEYHETERRRRARVETRAIYKTSPK